MAQHKQSELEHPAARGWVCISAVQRAKCENSTREFIYAAPSLIVLIAHWHHIYLLPVTGRSVPGAPVCCDLWPPQHLAAGVCFQLADKCKTWSER